MGCVAPGGKILLHYKMSLEKYYHKTTQNKYPSFSSGFKQI
jgi:hypothetical protein